MTNQHAAIRNLLPIVGVSVSLSAGAIFVSWVLFLLNGTSSFYFFSLLAVAFSAFYAGVRSGLLTIVLTTLAIDIIFIQPIHSLYIKDIASLIELLLFIMTCAIINYIFDTMRTKKDIFSYKKKEKAYLAQIEQLQKENKSQQKEIMSRDEFLSIASHELKTPLSAMLLQIQTALHNIRTVSLANFSVEKLLKMLQSTEQQSKRLSKMINDLLNISLIRTGRLELEKEPADLGLLVRDVTERFSDKAEREGCPIKISIEENVIGDFDKLRIEQAITNLISNAIKYGDHEPISVRVEKNGSIGKISVSDHGIGIPKDRQERIFERFERAVSNHTYKGLGVGLYITQHIVHIHHGRITLKSTPRAGSTFVIELPLTQQIKQPHIRLNDKSC